MKIGEFRYLVVCGLFSQVTWDDTYMSTLDSSWYYEGC